MGLPANLLDRLELMHSEINGLTVFRDPPPKIKHEDLPIIYAVYLGYTPDSFVQEFKAERQYRFLIEVLVTKIGFDRVDLATGASTGAISATTWADTVGDYYDNHRKMTTASEGALPYLIRPFTSQNEGVVFPLGAHDGQDYIGTQFNLAMDMTVFLKE